MNDPHFDRVIATALLRVPISAVERLAASLGVPMGDRCVYRDRWRWVLTQRVLMARREQEQGEMGKVW